MTAALLWLKLRAWAKPPYGETRSFLANIGWKGGCIALGCISIYLAIQLAFAEQDLVLVQWHVMEQRRQFTDLQVTDTGHKRDVAQ